jgi:hypothetical protein
MRSACSPCQPERRRWLPFGRARSLGRRCPHADYVRQARRDLAPPRRRHPPRLSASRRYAAELRDPPRLGKWSARFFTRRVGFADIAIELSGEPTRDRETVRGLLFEQPASSNRDLSWCRCGAAWCNATVRLRASGVSDGQRVGGRGFEPLTPSASRKCSPPELTAR